MSAPFIVMERMLSVAAVDLFAAHELDTSEIAPPDHPAERGDSVVIAIGFAVADGSRGSLVMTASRATVASLQGLDGGECSEAVLCDILGEFANMLLGRLKNSLLSSGVLLLLGTPAAAMVSELFLSTSFTDCRWLAFDVGGRVVGVRFAASLSEDFVLHEVRDDSPSPLAEGEMLLF